MTTDNHTPLDVIEAFEAAWSAMDFNALGRLWDGEDDDLYYVAEEIPGALRSFTEIQDYFAHTAKTVEWVRLELSDRHVKPLAEDLAVVTFDMHVEANMHGYAQQGFKPVGFDHRVSAILRSRNGDWRFIHYVEAPLGVLPFIRNVYNRNVRL